MSAAAQTVLRSSHFLLYNNSPAPLLAEKAIARLEELYAALPAMQNSDWVPSRPQRVWLTGSDREWLSIAAKPEEQGVYRSGPRKDWIVVNPHATHFLEVLSHEYVHAVLHHAQPNLPLWFEEGICEYYATLELRYKGNHAVANTGRPPGNRLAWLGGGDTIDLQTLSRSALDQSAYARGWAAAYFLWPDFTNRKTFPLEVPSGPFPLRTQTFALAKPSLHLTAVSPREIAELEAEFQTIFDTSSKLSDAGRSAIDAQDLFVTGLRLADNGSLDQALPLLEQACRLRPSNSSWWHTLALAYRDAAKLDKAREAAQTAIGTAVNPSETAAAETLSRSLK